MQTDYTHMTVILDRSGSMDEIRDDIIGGFNGLLGDHKAQPGKATMTLVQFDGQDPYEVLHRFKPLRDVPPLDRSTYVPRGGTPLFDAVGRGINDIEAALGKLAEADRPTKVIFAIVPEGKDNPSVELGQEQSQKKNERKGGLGTAVAWRAVSDQAGMFRRVAGHRIGFADEDRKRASEPDEK